MSGYEIVAALRHRVFNAAAKVSEVTQRQKKESGLDYTISAVLQELANPTKRAIPSLLSSSSSSAAAVFKSPLKTTTNKINDLQSDLQRSAESINRLKSQLQEARDELAMERVSIEELKKAMKEGGNQQIASIISAQEKEKEAKDKLQADLDKSKEELKKKTANLRREKKRTADLSTKIAELDHNVRRLNSKLQIASKASRIHATSAKEVKEEAAADKRKKKKQTISSVSSGPPPPPTIVVPPVVATLSSQPSSSSLLSASDSKRISKKKADDNIVIIDDDEPIVIDDDAGDKETKGEIENKDILVINGRYINMKKLLKGVHILLSDNKIFSAFCATFVTKIDPRFPKQLNDQITSAVVKFMDLNEHPRAREDVTMIYLIQYLMDATIATLNLKFEGLTFDDLDQSSKELAKVISSVQDVPLLNKLIDDFIIQYFMERYDDQRYLVLDPDQVHIPKTEVSTNSIFQSLESRIVLLEYLPKIGMTLSDILKQDKFSVPDDVINMINANKRSIECYSSGNYQTVAQVWNRQLKEASESGILDVPLLVGSSSSSSFPPYSHYPSSLSSYTKAPYSSTQSHSPLPSHSGHSLSLSPHTQSQYTGFGSIPSESLGSEDRFQHHQPEYSSEEEEEEREEKDQIE